MNAKIKVNEVSKSFGSLQAIERIDLTVKENEFLSIVGASGCGKSTLLAILAGLENATTGQVELDGKVITGPGRDRGVVFQNYSLLPWLNCRRNIEFALRGDKSLSRAERTERAREQLNTVGLLDCEESFPAELSGGMKQRVAIARALAYRPNVLLMDEPFGALDALTRRVMQELLTQVWEDHKLTVVFVTHDVDEAVFLSDRVIVMSNRPGKVKAEFSIDLPRPREQAMSSSPEFSALTSQVLDSIYQEALAVA